MTGTKNRACIAARAVSVAAELRSEEKVGHCPRVLALAPCGIAGKAGTSKSSVAILTWEGSLGALSSPSVTFESPRSLPLILPRIWHPMPKDGFL